MFGQDSSSTVLIKSIKKGDVKEVRRILTQFGRVAPMLMEKKVSVGADSACMDVAPVYMGAVHYAVRERQPEILQELLLWGADPNERAGHGMTALHRAALRSSYDCALVLLNSVRQPDQPGNEPADQPKQPAGSHDLHNQSSDVMAVGSVSATDQMEAHLTGNLQPSPTVSSPSGADGPSATSGADGPSATSGVDGPSATSGLDGPAAASGASIPSANSNKQQGAGNLLGKTSTSHPARSATYKVNPAVNMLYAVDEWGKGAVHHCASGAFDGEEAVKLLNLLIARGDPADVSILDEHERQPIHYAASACNIQVFDRLLELGADPSAEDKNRSTPFDMAKKQPRMREHIKGLWKNSDPSARPGLNGIP